MYICICSSVTDSDIRDEVRNGACCLQELKARLGVAACCGQCKPQACSILKERNSPQNCQHFEMDPELGFI